MFVMHSLTYSCWNGPFDPEAFDARKATREMRKVIKLISAED